MGDWADYWYGYPKRAEESPNVEAGTLGSAAVPPNTREFRVAQGMVEQSFDFDFTDLPLEWQGDLIEWANRTLRWRDERDVTITDHVSTPPASPSIAP